MANMTLMNAYQTFRKTAGEYLDILTEADCQRTLQTVEELLEEAEDISDDPLNPLIELLSRAIADYESRDKELSAFINKAESIPMDTVMNR